MGGSPKTDGTSAIDGEARKLGFGEFADWAYAEVIMRNQRYARFTLGGTASRRPGKKRFIDRIRYKEGITMGGNTGSVE